jgi:hypothetical protein
MTDRPPLPPFDRESALTKVQAAEDAWNTRDPERVAGAYTADSAWRNRDAFFTGRPAVRRISNHTSPARKAAADGWITVGRLLLHQRSSSASRPARNSRSTGGGSRASAAR